MTFFRGRSICLRQGCVNRPNLRAAFCNSCDVFNMIDLIHVGLLGQINWLLYLLYELTETVDRKPFSVRLCHYWLSQESPLSNSPLCHQYVSHLALSATSHPTLHLWRTQRNREGKESLKLYRVTTCHMSPVFVFPLWLPLTNQPPLPNVQSLKAVHYNFQ